MSFDYGRVGDLEIREDHEFQRLTWRLQRVLWTGMAALLGLALLGLFGSGPLSDATVGPEGGPLHLKYQRFARFRSPTTLELQVGPGWASEAKVRLVLRQSYLDGIQIEQVEPEPERVIAGPEGSTLVFPRNDPERPTRVRIHVIPEQRGPVRGHLRLEDGPALQFLQFVYP